MKKFDNKGFALVETLIVSVFVVSLFLIVFNNFYPLMSEYEKREVYDDIDGVYAAYWIKRLVEDSSLSIDDLSKYKKNDLSPNDCDDFGNFPQKLICQKVVNAYGIQSDYSGDDIIDKTKNQNGIYIVDYNISRFKKMVNGDVPSINRGYYSSHVEKFWGPYLNTLPDYSNPKNNTYDANFRVIISMKRYYQDIDGKEHAYRAYANMEGKK